MEGQAAEKRSLTLRDRLDKLTELESEIGNALHIASQIMGELSKEKVVTQRACDGLRDKFSQSVKKVDKEISAQIEHLSQVSVGSSHEGSIYIPLQEKLAAQDRLDLAKKKVKAQQATL